MEVRLLTGAPSQVRDPLIFSDEDIWNLQEGPGSRKHLGSNPALSSYATISLFVILCFAFVLRQCHYLCSLGCPGTLCVDLTGFQLREPPSSAS